MAEKKRSNSNTQRSGGKGTGRNQTSRAKQSAAKQAASEREEQAASMPVGVIISCVCGAVSIALLFALFGASGAFFVWVSDFFCGLFGKAGFSVLPFALGWITAILFFPSKRRAVSRCIGVVFCVMCIGGISQVFCDSEIVWGFPMFRELYFGGMEGSAAGVLCGIFGGGLTVIFGNTFTVIILVVVFLICFLSAANLPLGSLIRAYRNRPRPEPIEEPEPEIEPAEVLVNHFAQKHIERVERKRQISDFDLPVDDPVILTGEQQDFLSKPLPTEKKARGKKRREPEPEKASVLDNGGIQEPQTAPEPKFEAFDGLPILEEHGLFSQRSQKKEDSPAHTAIEPFDLEEFPPLHPEYEEQIAPEPEELVEPMEPQPSKQKPLETQKEAEKIDAEVAKQATIPAAEYSFPPIDLLKPGKGTAEDGTKEMRRNSELLQETLESFHIDAQICNVTRGPSVTRYELKIDMGVRLSRVTALADDIALALGASGVRIAAIPDKQSVVGIEVPNRSVTMVPIRDVISSADFARAKSKTSFALGKDISGNCVIGDISSLPHLLIAGTTGSGKSVCMNSIIISTLYKSQPDEVKLIMVDPKMVELGVYNGIPHLLIPVVTDPKKAAGALQWAVTEMLRRYRLMSDAGTRELSAYNAQVEASGEAEKLPKIVVIIDELADLMMIAAKEVEESICRIAQMGRAAGIHLIIATQRPSANVITGLMKANIPSRVAFAVASAMESRIILDSVGAEKLVGKGDMLYAPLGSGKPKRVQGCFISDTEVETVAEYVKSHYATSYSQDVMEEIERKAEQEPEKQSDDKLDDTGDELLPAAVDVILETKQASVSMLQRRLKLGYARAARIVDEMEERGIVGPFVGSKPREILITKEQWQQMQSGSTGQMSFDEDTSVPEEIP